MRKIISFILIFVLFFNLCLPLAQAEERISLNNYLAYFYNRYSEHLDENGLIFKTPDYEVPEFREAQSAREILSLVLYYKYRALAGDIAARQKIRDGILAAQAELNSRGYHTQSFSDAFAQLAMVKLIDDIPFILNQDEIDQIYEDILNRAESGIKAPDTSNRAALSAVYWQYIVNNLFNKGLILDEDKAKFDALIYAKIKPVLEEDIDANNWYKEGRNSIFNPHYHMITAFAFMSYGNLVGDFNFLLTARAMTANLRSLSFPNGMVEARLGSRPIGLGAQFYLGAALLNAKFNYSDFAVYLNYAQGDKFFSDPAYPNRLEYHSTRKNTEPNFHDDISFSNLAELALLSTKFRELNFYYKETMAGNDKAVIKHEDFTVVQDSTGDFTYVRNKDGVVKGVATVVGEGLTKTYNEPRLSLEEEELAKTKFIDYLKQFLNISFLKLSQSNLETLINAYIYGGYSIREIADTVKNGPRAVHPSIPASIWRDSPNYQSYLNSLKK